jgi:hypothetical protein
MSAFQNYEIGIFCLCVYIYKTLFGHITMAVPGVRRECNMSSTLLDPFMVNCFYTTLKLIYKYFFLAACKSILANNILPES